MVVDIHHVVASKYRENVLFYAVELPQTIYICWMLLFGLCFCYRQESKFPRFCEPSLTTLTTAVGLQKSSMSKTKVSHGSNRSWSFNNDTRATATRAAVMLNLSTVNSAGGTQTFKTGKQHRIDVLVSVYSMERQGNLTQALWSVQEGQPCAGTIAGI